MHKWWTNQNIGMLACKRYFLSWVGRDGTLCVRNVFITFKRTKISHSLQEKEKNVIYLNSHRYGVVVYCLNTSEKKISYIWAKIKMHRCYANCILLRSRCLVSSIPLWKESRCVTRPNNGCETRTTLTAVPPTRKKIKIICPQLVASKL